MTLQERTNTVGSVANGGNPFWIHGNSMSSETIRHRDTEYFSGLGAERRYYQGEVISSDSYPMSIVGRETTRSWDNPQWSMRRRALERRARNGEDSDSRRIRQLKNQDVGGPFFNSKQLYGEPEVTTPPLSLRVSAVGGYRTYDGPLFARSGLVTPLSSLWPTISEAALHEEMLQKGTTAIARTVPTNPAVGVGQAIGESLERLPSLPGAALLGRPGNVSKRFADEYLNYEFGLKPLFSDIEGIARTVRDSNQILEQLERDSGRLVRRRYSFPEERTIETVTDTAGGTGRQPYPPIDVTYYNGGSRGRYILRRETIKRMWFSGAYTYKYVQGSDLWARLRRAEQQGNRLFGLRINPSLLWELAPWSWAADWVTNAGDVMTNLSAFNRDGLVLRWGYMMCSMRIIETHTVQANLKAGSRTLVQTFETQVKKRIRATPYGFGLDPDWADFTDRQLAILSALGISRGR